MAILVDRDTRILIQGITGRQGSLHARLILEYGADVVAGVTPGKGGAVVHGVPVYDTVAEACEQEQPNASLVLVPPAGTLQAGLEAIHAGIPLVVVITEHVPVLDTVHMRAYARKHGTTIVGPNTIGVISPGKSKVGIMPGALYSEGRIGILSRSGTLTHEVASALSYASLGQSTCIGIGGDPVCGMDFVQALQLFRDDPETEVVIIVGEIGGVAEESGARYLQEHGYPKPVIAFIAGRTAPPGQRMGHAGAIIQEGAGTAMDKIAALRAAGVEVMETVDQLVEAAKRHRIK
jgi:succinyl-CoA synthetase alpha subunit